MIAFSVSCLDSNRIGSVSLLNHKKKKNVQNRIVFVQDLCLVSFNSECQQTLACFAFSEILRHALLVSFPKTFFFNLCIFLQPSLHMVGFDNLLKVGGTTLAYFKPRAVFKGAYLKKPKGYCGCLFSTLLKTKVLYWHLQFHDEPLTSMGSFFL